MEKEFNIIKISDGECAVEVGDKVYRLIYNHRIERWGLFEKIPFNFINIGDTIQYIIERENI